MVYQQTSLEGQHLVDTTLSPLVLDGWEAQFVAPTGSPLIGNMNTASPLAPNHWTDYIST